MKKKIAILFLLVILLVGCNKKEENEVEISFDAEKIIEKYKIDLEKSNLEYEIVDGIQDKNTDLLQIYLKDKLTDDNRVETLKKVAKLISTFSDDGKIYRSGGFENETVITEKSQGIITFIKNTDIKYSVMVLEDDTPYNGVNFSSYKIIITNIE